MISLLAAALPYYETGPLLTVGALKIEPFGVLVAIGVIIGSELMRRKYGPKLGLDDDDVRLLTGWVMVSGFIGAHVLDVLMYEPHKLEQDGLLALLKLWDGISSFGGFVGGFIGFAIFLWWKRLDARIMADTTLIGLLPAFTIGRIGCTIVHDHIGRATESNWGFDYPWSALVARGLENEFARAEIVRAHNLGFYEFLWLAPMNLLIMYLAFFSKRRLAAGMLPVITVMWYAPFRFVLEYWRLNTSDPRHLGFTFAQWGALLAFVGCGALLARLLTNGTPAPLAVELGNKVGGRLYHSLHRPE